MTPRLMTLLFAAALGAGIALLYSFGLHNQLVFDDGRLMDGTIFGQYGSLVELKARLLSYGSFVWIQTILGEGWWKQRIFNIGLHIATALTLYAFVLQLLQRTQWGEGDRESPAFPENVRPQPPVGPRYGSLVSLRSAGIRLAYRLMPKVSTSSGLLSLCMRPPDMPTGSSRVLNASRSS